MVGPIFFVGAMLLVVATMLFRIRRLEKICAEYQARTLLVSQISTEDEKDKETKAQNQVRIEVTQAVLSSVMAELELFRDAVITELPRVVEDRASSVVAAHLSESYELVQSLKTALASGFVTHPQLLAAIREERNQPRTSSEISLIAYPILMAVGNSIRMERHVGVQSGSTVTLRDYPLHATCSVSVNNRWLQSYEYYVAGQGLFFSGVCINPTDEILVVYLSSQAGGNLV